MTKTLTATDDSPKWYFVDFPGLPSRERLKSHNIVLATTSFISRGFYNLFLSSSQVRFLVDECDCEVSEVRDKLINGRVPLHSADYLVVEVAESFNPSLHQTEWFRLDRVSSTIYFVKGKNINRISSYFVNVNEVYSITPVHYPKLKNYLGAGYSQLNTKTLDKANSFPRYLQELGLTGEGVVVTVMDDGLDRLSTFFYDPENPFPGPNHRKILADVDAANLTNSSHGTHVCGTVAGNSANTNASRYNGVAPLAKILHFTSEGDTETYAGMFSLLDQYMKQYDSHISTNSWGNDGFFPSVINQFDKRAHEEDSFLYLFAAGNEQEKDYYKMDKFMTLCSPSPSKNVVAVGALGHLPLQTVPDDKRVAFEWKYSAPHGEFVFYGKLRTDLGSDPFEDGSKYEPESVTYVVNESDWTNSETQEDVTCVIAFIAVNGTKRTYPVFYIDDPAALKLYQDFSNLPKKPSYEFYYEFQTGEPKLSDFSSKGPSMVGIIKPDVVAPGEHILSAASRTNGTAEHDINPVTVAPMSGTSMATPNVAGIAALIQQYFRSGIQYDRIIQPTARFLKGMLIHCADPIPSDRKFPNNEVGFGQINLGAYLPFENSSFSILINETVSISKGQHLVSNVSVLSNATAFRVTMSYLDAAGSADSLAALIEDLDLVLVSKTGKVFRGNHYLNGSEEHFSTTERVIVNPNEIEVGDYEIHVIAAAVEDDVTFALITTGVLSKNPTKIEFKPATSCVPCGNGTCVPGNFTCNCSTPTRIGHSCQIEVQEIPVSQGLVNQSFTVQPLESLYVRVTNPSNANNYTIHVSGDSRIILRLFANTVAENETGENGVAGEYSLPVWNNISQPSDWEKTFSSPLVELIVRNEFSVPWKFYVWTKPIAQAPTIAPPVPPGPGTLSRSSTNSSDNASTGLSGGIVAVIVIVPVVVVAAAVVIVVFLLRRRNDGISRFDGP